MDGDGDLNYFKNFNLYNDVDSVTLSRFRACSCVVNNSDNYTEMLS